MRPLKWERFSHPSNISGRFARIGRKRAQVVAASMGRPLPSRPGRCVMGEMLIDGAHHRVQLSNEAGRYVLLDCGLTLAQREASGLL